MRTASLIFKLIISNAAGFVNRPKHFFIFFSLPRNKARKNGKFNMKKGLEQIDFTRFDY